MRGFGQAFDGIIGVRTRIIPVHPQAQLKLQAAPDTFLADKFEHLQIAIALRVRKSLGAHAGIFWQRDQKGIREKHVNLAAGRDVIVAQTKGEVEAIEALRRQHRQIFRPELAVIEPRLVFQFALEGAADRAGLAGRLLDDG